MNRIKKLDGHLARMVSSKRVGFAQVSSLQTAAGQVTVNVTEFNTLETLITQKNRIVKLEAGKLAIFSAKKLILLATLLGSALWINSGQATFDSQRR